MAADVGVSFSAEEDRIIEYRRWRAWDLESPGAARLAAS
jgi:hypothetical protein